MKKLVLMLSAALISMAAQATIYVTGGNVTGAPAAWDPQNPLQVELAGGVYTFKATGGFKISTAKGGWDSDFNPNAKTLNGDWNKATTTATASLKAGTDDITAPMDGVEITYEVASDLSTIKATLPEGNSFGDPVAHTYALHGQITGNESWESTDLTENNGVWEWTGTVVAGEFGIKELTNGSQSAWIAADGTTAVNAAGEYAAKYNGSNWVSTLAGEYTFSFNPTTMKLTITGQGTVDPDPNPDPDPQPTVPENVYLVGTFENAWSTTNPVVMTKSGNKFTVETELKASSDTSTDGYFSFITATGANWDAVNGSDRYGASAQDEPIALSTDVAYTVFKAGVNASSANSWKLAAGTYTFTIDFDSKTVRVDVVGGTDPDPDPDPDPQPTERYALHGTITGDPNWASVELTANSGKYEWTGGVVAGDFGIKVMDKDGNQTGWISAADETAVSAEGTYNTSASGIGNWTSTLEGNYTFSFDPTANTLTITKYEGEVQIVKSYALKGTITNGDSTEWVSTAMTEAADGTWSWSGTVDTGEFGIQYLENGVQQTWYASADESNAIAAAGEYNAQVNGTNWALSLTGDVTLKFDPTTLVLTVTGGTTVDPDPDPDPDPTIETPENVYIVGNFENAWSTSEPITMTKNGNKFTATATLQPAGDTNDAYFSFVTAKGADWDTVNGSDRYGAKTADEPITLETDTEYKVFKAGVDASAAKSWKVSASTYKFTIDFESKTVRLDIPSGVEEIELAEEAEAEYYNLQGVKVANPSNGVYIRVINGKATKVVK